MLAALCACLQRSSWHHYLPWTAPWSKGMWDLCKSVHSLAQWSPVEWSQQCRWLSAVSSHQDERRASVSQRQRLHLDHRRPRAPAQLHRSWDHRRPAVWKGIKRIALQFICGNEPEPSHVHLSLNEFARARQESHLASRLGRSDAARWFGRSRSCRDPRLLWPGSDSSGTSSPHLPWDKKGASELSVRCVCVCVGVSFRIPETPASVRCAIQVFPHSHHLPDSKRPPETDWKRALNVQDGRCPLLWINTTIRAPLYDMDVFLYWSPFIFFFFLLWSRNYLDTLNPQGQKKANLSHCFSVACKKRGGAQLKLFAKSDTLYCRPHAGRTNKGQSKQPLCPLGGNDCCVLALLHFLWKTLQQVGGEKNGLTGWW